MIEVIKLSTTYEFTWQNSKENLQNLNQSEDSSEVCEPADGDFPATSKSFKNSEEVVENKDEPDAENKGNPMMDKLKLIPVVVSSVLVSITLKLHQMSRNYRFVLQVIAHEKTKLKVS